MVYYTLDVSIPKDTRLIILSQNINFIYYKEGKMADKNLKNREQIDKKYKWDI